jgi:hypothetical protein
MAARGYGYNENYNNDYNGDRGHRSFGRGGNREDEGRYQSRGVYNDDYRDEDRYEGDYAASERDEDEDYSHNRAAYQRSSTSGYGRGDYGDYEGGEQVYRQRGGRGHDYDNRDFRDNGTYGMSSRGGHYSERGGRYGEAEYRGENRSRGGMGGQDRGNFGGGRGWGGEYEGRGRARAGRQGNYQGNYNDYNY